jgi:diguanylate cyclase (GGDEF)-like protein
VDSTGRVLIATAGVSVFLGRPRARRAADPVAVITSARAGGRDLTEYPEGLLPARSGAISFRFTAPSFTSEGSVRFRYRLRGLDDSWVRSAPGQDETTYGGLGPGRYELEVLAETADGRVSRAPARASFGIRPLFYRTITFSALAFGLLLTAIATVVRLRENRLEAAREALEKQVWERAEELRRVNERLASLAVTDELTGLANRRRILEAMNEEIAFARRRDLPFSVAMADLDHFKEVNDASGHAAGDRLLVAAAAAMKDVLRTEDLLGRVGGEEFLAVLPGTDAEGARAVGERIRRAVEKAGLGPAGHLATTSVGVASIMPGLTEVTDAGELLRRADAALYRAKSLGRNRVEAFEQPAGNP